MPEILAKSGGKKPITLEAHTVHVVEEAEALLNAQPFVEEKYAQRTGESLRDLLLQAAEVHDWGKQHPTWQKACRRDREVFLKTGRTGSHLMRAGLRHEFDSLRRAEAQGAALTLPQRAAIAAHHGKLSFRHEHRWLGDDDGAFGPLWNAFVNTAYQWEDPFSQSPDRLRAALDERYRIAGVRSLLQLADTRASRREAGGWLPDIEAFSYTFPYSSPRGVQEAVKRHWDQPEMILRAPTGSGKTDAALLWAKHQIDNGRADRLVLAMPTRFTSNALSVDVDKNVSDTGLYHSSAWHARFHGAVEAGAISKDDAREVHRMARLLMAPVTVCTIDHLCMALTGTREDHHGIFFNLANACVVIDEADFYDAFVQANILMLLKMLRHFDVPVLIMSATVPASAKTLYGIDHLAEDRTDADKVRCFIHDAGAAEKPPDIEATLTSALDSEKLAIIVYANTVSRALDYYDWFCDHGVEPILYHSRFVEGDKKEIEERLIAALGREAWAERRAGGVAILTQIGEMSLNISAPLMVGDLCPYDRLAQRAGRLSRFEGMEPGTLHLVTPMKNGTLYPAPYGEYLLDEKRWKVGRPLAETQNTMRFGPYSARDFVEAVNALYPRTEPPSERTERNRRHLEEHMRDNWLIVPKDERDEDADETERWRSRDIPPQRTVLTQRCERFESYAQYHAFELECGVDCPVWQIELGRKLGRVGELPIQIADDDEIVMPYSPNYSRHEGLILDRDRERSTRDCMI